MELKDVKYKFTGGRGGWKGDVPDVVMDISRIKKLGWSAKLSSREAVERAASEILGER
jgi:UDP-glucose 4-epimerase